MQKENGIVNDSKVLIAKNIRHYRALRNYSQQKVELMAGIRLNYVSLLESGTQDVKLSTLDKIANIFEIETMELLKQRSSYLDVKRINNKKGKR